MRELFFVFQDVEDPRRGNARRHDPARDAGARPVKAEIAKLNETLLEHIELSTGSDDSVFHPRSDRLRLPHHRRHHRAGELGDPGGGQASSGNDGRPESG